MECPVCKYPNPAGVTHCGMCYEVFNRSAAQNYQHAMRRERMQENPPESEEPVILSQKTVDHVKSAFKEIDWAGIFNKLKSVFMTYRKPIAVVISIPIVWVSLSFLFSPDLWYHLLGKKLSYAFSDSAPTLYLVGMKTTVKSWSERQARLDSPLGNYQLDEIGRMMLMKKKKTSTKGARPEVIARAKEWIQVSGDSGRSMSRIIPRQHDSLAGAKIILNKRGSILERRFAMSPRVGKSIPFIVPRTPPGRLHEGAQWTEDIDWVDVFDDWQIRWKGTLHWALGELIPCEHGTCAQLSYTADVSPRLWGLPGWAQGHAHRVEAAASGEGTASFDVKRHILVANTFSYDGFLRIPLDNLARIPRSLRVGRGTRGAGDIVIRFENKIDVRKN